MNHAYVIEMPQKLKRRKFGESLTKQINFKQGMDVSSTRGIVSVPLISTCPKIAYKHLFAFTHMSLCLGPFFSHRSMFDPHLKQARNAREPESLRVAPSPWPMGRDKWTLYLPSTTGVIVERWCSTGLSEASREIVRRGLIELTWFPKHLLSFSFLFCFTSTCSCQCLLGIASRINYVHSNPCSRSASWES